MVRAFHGTGTLARCSTGDLRYGYGTRVTVHVWYQGFAVRWYRSAKLIEPRLANSQNASCWLVVGVEKPRT